MPFYPAIRAGKLHAWKVRSSSGGGAAVPGLTPTLRQVATGSRPASSLQTATFHSFNSRSPHFARDTITSLKIELPNWYVLRTANPFTEVGPGNSVTYKASIEYPSGTFTQVLFSGSTSAVVANAGSILSDFVDVAIPKDALFWVRVNCDAGAGQFVMHGQAASANVTDVGNGALMRYSGTYTDLSMGGTITPNIAGKDGPCFYPSAIVAMSVVPAIGLYGDSRVWGASDTHDSSGDLGEIARSIGPSFGYGNNGIYGEYARDVIVNGAKRIALAQYYTHIVCNFGANDLINGRTAVQLQADLQTLWGMFPGKPKFQSTIAVFSTGAWTAVDGSDQTVNGVTPRNTVNTYVRAAPTPLTGYFEVANQVELTVGGGKWKAPGYTPDGVHETQLAALAIKNSGAILSSAFVAY